MRHSVELGWSLCQRVVSLTGAWQKGLSWPLTQSQSAAVTIFVLDRLTSNVGTWSTVSDSSSTATRPSFEAGISRLITQLAVVWSRSREDHWVVARSGILPLNAHVDGRDRLSSCSSSSFLMTLASIFPAAGARKARPWETVFRSNGRSTLPDSAGLSSRGWEGSSRAAKGVSRCFWSGSIARFSAFQVWGSFRKPHG